MSVPLLFSLQLAKKNLILRSLKIVSVIIAKWHRENTALEQILSANPTPCGGKGVVHMYIARFLRLADVSVFTFVLFRTQPCDMLHIIIL